MIKIITKITVIVIATIIKNRLSPVCSKKFDTFFIFLEYVLSVNAKPAKNRKIDCRMPCNIQGEL